MTASLFYSVFPTAAGPMGAVAAGNELVRIILPHYQRDELLAILTFEYQGAAEDSQLPTLARLAELSQTYFNGQAVNFDDLPCKLPSPKSFAGLVLRACREIPYGQTVSYSHLARTIGREDAARAVAAALGKNTLPLVIPCHRVTYADGRLGGFSAEGGEALKRRMLGLEGATPGR
jgi:methylated-DNA-[protein]-cysteine S-methyltransferase